MYWEAWEKLTNRLQEIEPVMISCKDFENGIPTVITIHLSGDASIELRGNAAEAYYRRAYGCEPQLVTDDWLDEGLDESDDLDLAKQFEFRLWEMIPAARQDCHVNPGLGDMLLRYGGVETARRLVSSGSIQGGLRKMVDAGRPELTVEAWMCKQPYMELFTEGEIAAAQRRLQLLSPSRA